MKTDYPVAVRLSKVLARRRLANASEISTTHCTADYRQCRPGSLFAAIDGPGGDGHELAGLAIEAGASAILCERLLPYSIPQCIVPDSRAAFGKLVHRLNGDPSRKLHTIGVAGCHGLPSAAFLTAGAIEAGDQVPAVCGSIGMSDGVRTATWQPQTAARDAAVYADWLARSVAQRCSHAIVEMPRSETLAGSHAGLRLDTLLLTGLGSESQPQRPNPETLHYFRRLLGRLKPEGMIIANVDCPIVRDLVDGLDRAVLTVGIRQPADVSATLVEQLPSEQTFLLEAGDETAVVRTSTIGRPHVIYSLLAAGLTLSMHRPLEQGIRGLESVDYVPGHLERIECGQRYAVFVDAAATPGELSQTLRTVRNVTSGRLFCVLGEGEPHHSSIRWRRGQLAEKLSDRPVLTVDAAGTAAPLRSIHDLLDGFQQPAKAHVMPNRFQAIQWALDGARPGDSVVIVGPANTQAYHQPDALEADGNVVRFLLLDTEPEDTLPTVGRN